MIQLEPATGDQLPALLVLDAEASAWPWPKTALSRHLAKQQLWSAFEGSALVGFVVAQSVLDETSLLHLVVGRSHQGRGIGARLLALWLKRLCAAGQQRCLLEVRASNAPALRLYRKLGFSEIGRRPGYYPAESGTETAIVMALVLTEPGADLYRP